MKSQKTERRFTQVHDEFIEDPKGALSEKEVHAVIDREYNSVFMTNSSLDLNRDRGNTRRFWPAAVRTKKFEKSVNSAIKATARLHAVMDPPRPDQLHRLMQKFHEHNP